MSDAEKCEFLLYTLRWVTQKKKKLLPLSSKMEIENFSVAGGWLENLMEKHSSTTLGGLCGESADDPDSTMDRRPSKCNSKFWR